MVQDCLIERYPDVKVTELIISKTEETKCNACTDANPQTDRPNDPDYCNPEEKFFAYDYKSVPTQGVPVTDTSSNLWFKAGYCGSTMDIINGLTESFAQFQTTFYKPITVDPATQIVSQRTIIQTNITCDYSRDILDFDMFPNAKIVPDGSSPDEK